MCSSGIVSRWLQSCRNRSRSSALLCAGIALLFLLYASAPISAETANTGPDSATETQRSVVISPACPRATAQWYIEIRYRYRAFALKRQIRFALRSTADTRWSRSFAAAVHAQANSLQLYDTLLPGMPHELRINRADEAHITVIDVACHPYAPFPSTRNRTTIPVIGTAALVMRNDFDSVTVIRDSERSSARADNRGSARAGTDNRADTNQHADIDHRFFIYRWSHFPQMLIVDTADYRTLGRLFNRLAFFIEKKGSAGTIYSDAELAGRFAWNGHNYNAGDLAHFYNTARRQQVRLNSDELRLRDILVAHGVLHRSAGDRYAAVDGGLVAVSQQSGGYTRRLILQHELLHALFYSSDSYRAAVWRVWRGLSDHERSGWRALLGHLTYDPQNEYVMVNEFQAYLLAKPRDESIPQLTALANIAPAPALDSASDTPSLAADDAASLYRAHAQLSLLLTAHTGLTAGSLRNIDAP